MYNNESSDLNENEKIEMAEVKGGSTCINEKKNYSGNLIIQRRIFTPHTRHLLSRKIQLSDKIDRVSSGMPVFSSCTNSKTSQSSNLVLEDHATLIANHMEQNDELMQNDPQSELFRAEILRDMPQYLTVKRSVKAKLMYSAGQRSERNTIGYCKRLKYRISMTVTKFNTTLREIFSTMELWYYEIKSIEGHSGSSVATYFKFLRWLFIVNTISSLLSIFFIIIPQFLVGIHTGGTFNFKDLLFGDGFLTNSTMYYGFYSNTSLEIIPGNFYHIPTAYFLTLSFCYFYTFLFLCAKVARSYRICFIETSGGIYNPYAMKIFCGWDFGISSHRAAKLRSASIYRELKELLAEAECKNDSSCFMKFLTVSVRILMTFFIVMMMFVMGVLLWILLKQHEADITNASSALTVPLIVTGIINVFPFILSWLIRLEKYNNERVILYVTVIRIYTMILVVIGTLLTFWLTRENLNCWQTQLAQEIYRLTIIDLIVSIIGEFSLQVTRYQLHTHHWKTIDTPNFDIAKNTMNLVYNQTIFWIAFYFSPMMSIVIVLKMLLTFYIKKFGLLEFCEPPSSSWRAAQTETLFLAFALIGMIGALIVLGFVIINKEIGDCGPFVVHRFTWEFIAEDVMGIRRGSIMWLICQELVSPGSMSLIFLIMCISIYYLRAKAEAVKEMVRVLQEMLVMQAKDREFLLKGFVRIATGARLDSLSSEEREETNGDSVRRSDNFTQEVAGPSNNL